VKYLDPKKKLPTLRVKRGTPQGYFDDPLPWIEKTITPKPVKHTVWHALYDAIRNRKKFSVGNEHVIEIMRVVDEAKRGTEFESPIVE